MARILRDVYAIDFFHPPRVVRGAGIIPADAHRAAWEQYSRQKWEDIRRAYNVTQVLARADWSLNLRMIAQSGELRLY